MKDISKFVLSELDEMSDTKETSEPKKSILEQAARFDRSNSTTIASLLREKNPFWAYEHLKNSGLYDTHAIIQGYAIIYSWIWEELDITDAMIIETGMRKRITAIFERFKPSRAPEYKEIMGMLDGNIQSWFLQQMIINLDRQRPGDTLSSGLENFPKRLPEKSPLWEKLEDIRTGNRDKTTIDR